MDGERKDHLLVPSGRTRAAIRGLEHDFRSEGEKTASNVQVSDSMKLTEGSEWDRRKEMANYGVSIIPTR